MYNLRQNWKKWVLIYIVIGALVYAGIYLFLSQKGQKPYSTDYNYSQPTTSFQPTTQPQAADITNWKTYTYKNISFQYPNDWVVIFDSEVAGQPNGFSLHVQNKDAAGYQPDGLYLSTFDNRAGLNDGYILNQDRKFMQRGKGDSYFQFEVNGTPIYSGCAFYTKGQATINICNQILSTFRFD